MISISSTTVCSSAFLCITIALLSSYSMAAPQFDLPAGADSILAEPLNTDFNCVDRPYGYYADVDNNCQLFHICLPIEDAEGNVIDTNQWTFLCSNGTVFDQQTLSCNYETDAFPCEESEQLYGTVMFGILESEIKKLRV